MTTNCPFVYNNGSSHDVTDVFKVSYHTVSSYQYLYGVDTIWRSSCSNCLSGLYVFSHKDRDTLGVRFKGRKYVIGGKYISRKDTNL